MQLTVMADPYERLLYADQRGWVGEPKMQVGKIREVSPQIAGEYVPKYKGFTLTAELRSSKPGLRGQQIQAELWYFSLTPHSIEIGENYRAANRFQKSTWRYDQADSKKTKVRRRAVCCR